LGCPFKGIDLYLTIDFQQIIDDRQTERLEINRELKGKKTRAPPQQISKT